MSLLRTSLFERLRRKFFGSRATFSIANLWIHKEREYRKGRKTPPQVRCPDCHRIIDYIEQSVEGCYIYSIWFDGHDINHDSEEFVEAYDAVITYRCPSCSQDLGFKKEEEAEHFVMSGIFWDDVPELPEWLFR